VTGARDWIPTAVLLLLLVLLVDARAWERASGPAEGAGVTSIRAFSTAEGLEPASLGGRPVADAILIDDLYLRSHPEAHGIRLAALSRERELRDYRNFDVAGSDGELAALLAQVERQPRDAVLVFSARGAIRPEGEDAQRRREALDQLMRELGAEGRPFRAPRASWALIALRGRRGWVRLAEAYAEDRPARLSFGIASDPAHYDGWQADLVRD
jgi:hypothetical protein